MSEFQVQTEKITGQIGEKNATGVFSSRISFEDGSVGTFVSCIFVSGGEELSSQVKDIFDIANKKLEGAGSGSLKILQEVSEASKSLIETHKLDSSFVHALFYKNASYFFRVGEKVKVIVYQNGKGQEIKFEHGSGHLKNGQVFLLGTEKFVSSFQLESYLTEENVNLEEVVDGLATEVSAKDDQSEIGAALVSVSEEVNEDAVLTQDFKDDGTHKKIESDMELNKPEPIMDPGHELESGEGDELNESQEVQELGESETSEPAQEVKHESGLSKFKNPVFAFLSSIGGEISSLRKGDILAKLRLRRNIVILGVLVLVILSGSAFYTLRGGMVQKKNSEISAILQSASSKYEEGVALIGLNQDKARVLLSEAKTEVEKVLAIDSENEEAISLAEKINAKLKETDVSASVNLTSILKVDGNILSLSDNSGNLVALNNEKIYEVTSEGVEVDTYDAPPGSQDGAIYDNKLFVFDGQTIIRVDLTDGSSEDLIGGESSQDIAVFFGNVYLLGSDQIYKYVPTEEGFTKGADYLSESISIDGGGRIAIDGSIWLTNGSNLSEFLRGEKESFSVSGLSSGVGNLGEIYTDSSSTNVYVIDRDNSSLLVFDKEGIFKQSYQSREFGNALGLVVDEEGGKFYIAVGNEILSGEL